MAKVKDDKTKAQANKKRKSPNKNKGKNALAQQAAYPAARPIDYSSLLPMQPSDALAEIVGAQALLHSEASRRVWMYVKSHRLQDPTNKLLIKPDQKLASIVGDKALSTVELTRAVRKEMKEMKKA